MSASTISPIEVFKALLEAYVDNSLVPNVVVGGLSHDQQAAGGVAIMDAGLGETEPELPLIRPRMQLRCIGPSLDVTERISRHVAFTLDSIPKRTTVHQLSTDEHFLIYDIQVSGGPSAHWDSEETWEGLLFAETLMSTLPVTV